MSKRVSNILVLLLAILLLFFYYWKGEKHKRVIKNNLQIESGKILECTVDHRTNLWVKYSFTYKNEVHYNSQVLTVDLDKGNLFVNKNFPVAISKDDPSVNDMLI